MAENKREIIDIEPSWEALCNMAQGGMLEAKALLPACKIADLVRQAQKKGKQGVIFTFSKGKNGKVDVSEVD